MPDGGRLRAVLRGLGRLARVLHQGAGGLARRWRAFIGLVGVGSIVAAVGAIVLNFLSLGALGALLYYPVAPLLLPFYPPFHEWMGDWVWGAITGVGFLWPWAFLAAGAMARRMQRAGRPRRARIAVYGLVLWAWALLLWWMTLASQF